MHLGPLPVLSALSGLTLTKSSFWQPRLHSPQTSPPNWNTLITGGKPAISPILPVVTPIFTPIFIDRPGIIIVDPEDVVYPCPMRSMEILANIVDGVAEVTLQQYFQTSWWEWKDITAHYQLPIDERAAVTEFKATVDDRIIQAVVKEKSVARQEFREAINSGQSAYLAEQTRADIFKISVGNLPPNKLVKVTLTYVTILEALGPDVVKFVLPTGIAPRYEPGPERNTESLIGNLSDLMNQGVQIQIDATSASSFLSISSPTHEIDVSGDLNQGKGKVKVIDVDPLNRDLVVSLKTVVAYQPKLYTETSDQYSNTAMMLSFVPQLKLTTKYNSEFIFIVDRSGSMLGEKIAQTRKALEKVLSVLPEGSFFNIIGFGSRFSALFDESQSQSDNIVLSSAYDYVRMMDANYGGTEILQPLKYVLESKRRDGFDRQVIVMTDGQVSNTADIIKYVKKYRSNTRIFSLGIGEHVSRLLVQGLARSGRGTAEFVDGDSDEAVFDAVERQMEVALTPALDDLEITWMDAQPSNIMQAPYVTPPLLVNKRFIMFFFLENGFSPTSVKITARDYQQDIDLEYLIEQGKDIVILPNSTTPNIIHKIAARAIIRDLEEGGSSLSLKDINANEYALQDKVNQEVARLGIEYQIASSQTSFIAVDNKKWSESPEILGNHETAYDVQTMAKTATYASPNMMAKKATYASPNTMQYGGSGSGAPPLIYASQPLAYAGPNPSPKGNKKKNKKNKKKSNKKLLKKSKKTTPPTIIPTSLPTLMPTSSIPTKLPTLLSTGSPTNIATNLPTLFSTSITPTSLSTSSPPSSTVAPTGSNDRKTRRNKRKRRLGMEIEVHSVEKDDIVNMKGHQERRIVESVGRNDDNIATSDMKNVRNLSSGAMVCNFFVLPVLLLQASVVVSYLLF